MPARLPEPPIKPRRRQSIAELRELQRLAMKVIIRPLSPDQQTQPTWEDGRSTRKVISSFIKPNDRLTSFERLQIYNRQYWFRLLDCLYDDYPGLRALLGERRFHRLRIAYLSKYPSRSFTLRNLGSRLVQFLEEEPKWAGPRWDIALEMARFEWAQIVAFDGPARPALSVDDLLGRDPSKLKLSLQPYLAVLALNWPLDDYLLAIKKRDGDGALRSEASNAMEIDDQESGTPVKAVRPPKRKRVFLAVHRFDNALYYKRLELEAFTILQALHEGKSLSRACAMAVDASADPQGEWTGKIQDWFRVWTQMGWFCLPQRQTALPKTQLT